MLLPDPLGVGADGSDAQSNTDYDMSAPFPLRFLRCGIALLLCCGLIHGTAWAQKAERKARLLEQGELLAQSCMSCHGTRGASTEQAVPTIGGQIDTFLVNSMKAYRDGTRPSSIMERIARAYSTKEIEAIAAYLAAQPFARPRQNTDPDKVTFGQTIHERKCKKCHLHGGRDTNEADSPLLAGQKLEYLRRNMEDILSGRRTIELKMNSALLELTRDEIDATLHYYAAQESDLR